MSKTGSKDVNNGLTSELLTVVHVRLTALAHDVHYLIHNDDSIEMIRAWYNFGFRFPTDSGRPIVRRSHVAQLSALGCLCALGWHFGRTSVPWLDVLEHFEKLANSKPDQPLFQVVTQMPESRKPDLSHRHD